MTRKHFSLTALCAFLLFQTCLNPSFSSPEPTEDPGHRLLFEQGMTQLRGGEHKAASNLILRAASAAEAESNWSAAYWYLWRLAVPNSDEWDSETQVRWYEQAEAWLGMCDRSHFQWRYVHLPNLIQMLCEKETVLSRMGRYGRSHVAYATAEKHLAELLGDPLDMARFQGTARNAKGIYINLLADRAEHQGYGGRLWQAEATYRQCIDFIRSMPQDKERDQNESRMLNNLACLLDLMGRNDESDAVQEEACRIKADSGASDIAELTRLRSESQTSGPSEELVVRLREKRDRLWKRRRYADALAADRRIASILFELGRREEASELFKTVIRDAGERQYWALVADAYLWRAKACTNPSLPGAEADYLAALGFYRREGIKPKEFRVYHNYARFLAKDDRPEEALRIVQEALRLNAFMDCAWLRPEVLALKATLLHQLGDLEAAESVWEEAFRLMDATPGIGSARRFAVYMDHLAYLASSGHTSAVAQASDAIRRFLETSNLTDYQTIRFRTFDPNATTYVVRPAIHAFDVELQPAYMATRIQGSGSGRAWFWLINPNGTPYSGRIAVGHPGAQGEIAQDGSLLVRVNQPSRATDRAFPIDLTIPADGIARIGCEAEVSETGVPERVEIRWEADTGQQSVFWDVIMDEAAGFQADIHASLLTTSPFYTIPIYHEIGGDASGRTGPIDFRVRASAPCRIEIYEVDKSLLAVDADGDGSFLGIGDSLYFDSNLDGFPDVDAAGIHALAVYPFLIDGESYGDRLDLVFEVRQDGVWTPRGSDRLLLVTPDGGNNVRAEVRPAELEAGPGGHCEARR